MSTLFKDIKPIRYQGPHSEEVLAYRHYNPNEVILGKRMEDHLRFAVCYWHSFCWPGTDMFGAPTMLRPWMAADDLPHARMKADAAFELFDLLGVPFFCFHDRDAAPEGKNLAEAEKNLRAISDYFARKMETSKTRLLWGTANLFSHPRYMAGAATNPDMEVFRYACAQVKMALEVTHELGGANYVLWGGREGYETLLNTNIKQELEQMGRFLAMVVEHKHKIGFKGEILVEPKPQEPCKHQYDFDVATLFGTLKRFGLEKEVKANIEVGHAVLAGHSFEHEVAMAIALGLFGSVDANRNDYQSGWDTDQFPNSAEEMTLALYHILQAGGFTTGGMNFDAKLRRQSIEPEDLLYGHIGGFDACAVALKAAAGLINDQGLEKFLAERYQSWNSDEGRATLSGRTTLAEAASRAQSPVPRSGRQEYLENLVHRHCLK